MDATLVHLLVGALVFGVIALLIRKAPLIDEPFKAIALWVLLILFVLWLLHGFVPGWYQWPAAPR